MFGLMFILIPIVPFMLYYFYWQRARKIKQSQLLLNKLVFEDPIWNINNLKETAKKTYIAIQDARKNRDLSNPNLKLSKKFHDKIQQEFDYLKLKQIINFREDIQIKVLEIIGIEDFKNNTKDTFKAYFEVYLYTYSSYRGEINKFTEKQRREEEIYCFVRNDNNWLLENIEDTYHSDQVAKVRIYKE